MVQYPRWVVIKGCSLIATDNLIITDNPCIYIAATSVCAGILFTKKGVNMEYNNYNEFLNTEEWKQVAEMVKDRDGHKCVICGSTENLNAHHICYEGDCLDENDIVTLCNRCHECLHDGIKKMREAVSGGVYEMLSDKLSDIVLDFYKRSFTKNEGRFEVCNHENFLKLQSVLDKSIKNQIRSNGELADAIGTLERTAYEALSKDKIVAERVDFVQRALKIGMKPWEIQKRLKITEKQYFKLIKKIKDGAQNG